MPDLEEVFRMSTQKVRPEPGALERQFGKQRRRSTRQRVAVYALVVGLVAGTAIGITSLAREDARLGNPDPEPSLPVIDVEGLPLTAPRLQGIWYEDPGTGVWPAPVMASFTPDGTFSLGGVLSETSWIQGTYEVEGRRITFTATGGACESTGSFTWAAGIVSEGRLEARHLGSAGDAPGLVGTCGIPVGEPYNFTRVSPTSPAAADIDPGYAGIAGAGPSPITRETSPLDLEGFWLGEGSSLLLRFDWSGSYRLDDGGELGTTPDDAGTVEIGRGTLRFITGGDAHGCAEGDVMVWRRVRLEGGRLRGVVSADSCGRDIGEEITLLFLDVHLP